MTQTEDTTAVEAPEQTLRVAHPSLVTRLGSLLFAAALMVAGVAVWLLPPTRPGGPSLPWQVPVLGIVLGVVLVLRAWILCHSSTFTVTGLRVQQAEGWLGRSTWETSVKDIRNITVRQTAGQRLFGIGTVEITSAAGPGVDVRFHGIRDPQGVRELIWKLKR